MYLRDTASRRVAIRFQGVLPVFVDDGEDEQHFETLDYSEAGLYMRELESGDESKLKEGQEIVGHLGQRDSSGSVGFAGKIVRVHDKESGFHYAVQVTSMTTSGDEEG
ncbi:MAG: PilZ domain-containing protein [Kofleriaceae bacterium]|nr:PilZ domain-containing protein [Kofleriaceae bacterium]